MSLRYIAGFLSSFYNPLEVADPPTGASASAGDTQADVSFTAPSNTGGSAITGYGVISSPGDFTATGSASPITVTGLTNGTPYTFKVWAINSYGPSAYSVPTGSIIPAIPQRGLIAGGLSPQSNVIEYIEISSLGNATDFGDLTVVTYEASSMSNDTRAVFAGGGSSNNVMSYVTILSTGDSTDFGDLTGTRRGASQGSINNTTRGIVGGGWTGSSVSQQIQYITFATTGNATNFGTIGGSYTGYQPASMSNSTRGIFAGADVGGNNTQISYITIATTGNTTNFGTLNVGFDGASGSGNATRGLFAQGYNGSYINNIQYITIASTGNALDFGDCSTGSRLSSASSNATRSVINAGSAVYPQASNIMEYVTIATTGNTTDFGDLTVILGERTACSSANGGVQ